MRQETSLELFISHILGLFNLALSSFLGCLHFDLVDDVESAAVVALQVHSAQLPDDAVFFNRVEEAVADVADQVLLLHFFEMSIDFLLERLSMLALAKKLFNLGEIVPLAVLLVLLENLDAVNIIWLSIDEK